MTTSSSPSGSNATIRRLEDTKPDARGEIEKRVFFTPGDGSDHVRFSMYRAKPGLKSDLHTNPGDDCTYIIQGEMMLEIDGEKHHVKAGDAVIIRKGAPHQAEIVGDEDFLIVSSHCEFCSLHQKFVAEQEQG